MISSQKSGVWEIAASLALLSVLLGALVAKVAAQNILGPAKIVDASSTIDNGWSRFPLDQIHDGITSDGGDLNGFVGRSGQLGSITFTLDAKYDINEVHIWNDIAVRAEGIENFTLRFFSDYQPMHAESFTGGQISPQGTLMQGALQPGVIDRQTFSLSKTVKNVNRIILRVDSIMQRPNSATNRVEVREVAFSGELAADQSRPLIMRNAEIPEFEPNVVLFFSRAPEAELRDIAANNGLTVREITDLDQLGVRMVSARIEPGDTVAEALARLEGNGMVDWAEPNAYFQLLDGQLSGQTTNSRSGGLGMHGLLFDGGAPPPPMQSDATIALIDSPVDTGNSNFNGALIQQVLVDVADTPSPHGTAIAELLVGTGDFEGVARGAQLMSYAAFEEVEMVEGTGDEVGLTVFSSNTDKLLKALNAIIELRPHVLNLSFGSKTVSEGLTKAINRLDSEGVCIASAVGNDETAAILFPANHPLTLGVTAIERSRRIYDHASRGPAVDIAAWGVSMNAAVPGGRRAVTGTSFATAIVSGAMLRMPACTAARDTDAMRNAIRSDAEDLDLKTSGKDSVFGHGLFRLGAESLKPMQASGGLPPKTSIAPLGPTAGEATNPLWYALAGAAAAGVLFLLFLLWRRRRKKEPEAG